MVGQRLRERRESLGLSRNALAERSGVYIDSIYNVETGKSKNPHGTTMAALNQALDDVARARGLMPPLPAIPPEPEPEPEPEPVAPAIPPVAVTPPPPLADETLGEEVRRRRLGVGLNVRELAIRAGIDRSTLTKMERGEGERRGVIVRKALTALEAIEAERGITPLPRAVAPPPASVITFTVQYDDVRSIKIEVPAGSGDVLARLVDRVMLNLRQ